MSRREIEANEAAKARRREQRIDRLQHQLDDLFAEYDGKVMPFEAVRKQAEIEDDLRELEAQRLQAEALLNAPTLAQKVEHLNNAVMLLMPEITNFRRSLTDEIAALRQTSLAWQSEEIRNREARNKRMDRSLIVLAILIAVAYGSLFAFGLQLYTVS